METLILIMSVFAITLFTAFMVNYEKLVKMSTIRLGLARQFPGGMVHVSMYDLSYCALHAETSKIALGLGQTRGEHPRSEDPYHQIFELGEVAKIEIRMNDRAIISSRRGFKRPKLSEFSQIHRVSLVLHIISGKTESSHEITFFGTDERDGKGVASAWVHRAIDDIDKVITYFNDALPSLSSEEES